MKITKISISLLILISLAVNGFAQKMVKLDQPVNDGSGNFAKKVLNLFDAAPGNAARQKAMEPFVIGFYGWKALAITRLNVGKIEAAHLSFSRIALSFYDDELGPTLKAIEARPTSPTDWRDVPVEEKNAIQKYVVQKYGGKYSGLADLFSDKLDVKIDRVAEWKYDLGAGLGELAGNVTIWYQFPNYPKFDQNIAEGLGRLDKTVADAPAGTSAVLLANIKKLSAFSAKTKFTAAEKTQVGELIRETLFSTLSFADAAVSANTTPPPPRAQPAPAPLPQAPARSAATIFESGKSLAEKGDDRRAISEFTEALRLDPQNGLIYFYRALSYTRIGETDKAIGDYDTAIMLKTSLSQAYYNRGTLYLNKKIYMSASADFDRSIALDKTSYKTFYNRGLAQYNLFNYDRAAADFTEAIRLNSNHTNSFIMRSRIFCKQGLIISAIRDQEQAIKLGATLTKGCE
ncbi:MAG: tetratricopeptide repeat protein [Pyrinomonadaceae bacterium]